MKHRKDADNKWSKSFGACIKLIYCNLIKVCVIWQTQKHHPMKNFVSTRFSLKYFFIVLVIAIAMNLLTFKITYAQDTKDFKFKLGITYNVSSGGGESHKLAMWV